MDLALCIGLFPNAAELSMAECEASNSRTVGKLSKMAYFSA